MKNAARYLGALRKMLARQRWIRDVIPQLTIWASIIMVGALALLEHRNTYVSAYITILANVVSITTSLILFAIALSLYKRFTGSQAILDKQTSACIELVETVESVRFVCKVYDNGTLRATLTPSILMNLGEHLEAMRASELKRLISPQYFGSSTLSLFQRLERLTLEVYMPRTVAKRVREITAQYTYPALSTTMNEDWHGMYLGVPNEKREHLRNRETGEYRAEGYLSGFSLDLILQDLRKIHLAAYDWLKENNTEVFEELNITDTHRLIKDKELLIKQQKHNAKH